MATGGGAGLTRGGHHVVLVSQTLGMVGLLRRREPRPLVDIVGRRGTPGGRVHSSSRELTFNSILSNGRQSFNHLYTNVIMSAEVNVHFLHVCYNTALFSSLGTFEQKKKQASSDHTGASEYSGTS